MSYAFALRYTPTTGLVPGGGFSGATAQPAAVGNSGAAGYAENAIARWNVVPYQTVAGTLGVGVVAFHIEGIASVKFSIDGGPWVTVTTPTLNADSGTVEYWTAVHASRHADGIHELRAIAIPVNGVPRVLAGMYVNTNAGASLPSAVRYVSATGNDANNGLTSGAPKLTIVAAALDIQSGQGSDCDGGTIYLLAGSYALANSGTSPVTVNRWLTLAPAPGVARTAAIITGTTGSGLNTKLLKLSGLTLSGTADSGGPLVDYCWTAGCAYAGTGTTSGSPQGNVGASFTGRYDTDSVWTSVELGPNAYDLVRGVTINGVGGDTFSNTPLVVNCTVTSHSQTGLQHSDEWQWTSAAANVILYGVDNTSGIGVLNSCGPTFEISGRDVAVIDCNLSVGSSGVAFYVTKPERHVYVRNTTIHGGWSTDGTFVPTNVVYEGNTYSDGNPPAGVTVR